MPSALRARCALLGAAAVLGGCGGAGAVVDRDATLQLRLGDPEYAIAPDNIRVRAGRIRIVAHNRGRLPHNVQVEEATNEEGVTPIDFGRTPTVQAGESAGVSLRLFPGTYRLVCTIGNHENLGQYAELEVTEAGS